MTPEQPDERDPRAPTRPRGHTLQDRLRRSAEQRAQHQARAHDVPSGEGDEVAALLDLLENGPAVPPIAPADPSVGPSVEPSVGRVDPAAGAPAGDGGTATPSTPPPPMAGEGTFTRETFMREVFTPASRSDDGVFDVPSSPAAWPAPTWDRSAQPDDPGAPDTWDVSAAPIVEPPQLRGGDAPPGDASPEEAPPGEAPTEGRSLPAVVPFRPAAPSPDEGEHDAADDELDDGDGPGTDVVLAPGLLPDAPGKAAGLRTRRRMHRDLRQAKRESRMAKRRYRIFPRTIIGITAMLLVAAIAAGASGAVLYAYYDWRLTQNEDRVGDLAEGLETRLTDANVAVENATNEAVEEVRTEGEALRELINDQNQIAELQPLISESVWYVSTLDDSGRASVGSAFVVAGSADGSLLLTSYATVSASTVDPAPEITLRKGDRTMVATLYAWDPERDLALLTVDQPDMAPLTWANEDERAEAAGKRGFVVTGLGGADATFSPGQVLDLTATGIQHNVAISEQFQGGPLLTAGGKVLGVASMDYNPLNFESTGGVSFAVPVGLACEQVLSCNGDASGAG